MCFVDCAVIHSKSIFIVHQTIGHGWKPRMETKWSNISGPLWSQVNPEQVTTAHKNENHSDPTEVKM